MLEGTRHRSQRFKRGQRTENEKGNKRTRLCVSPNIAGSQPQHGYYRHAADQHHQRLREGRQLRLTALGLMPVQLRTFHPRAVALAGTKNGQLCLPLKPGGQLLAVVPAQARQVFPGGFPGAVKQRRQNDKRQQHDPAQRQRNGNIQNRQPQRDHHNHHKRAHDRGNHAQVKVIQRVNVRHHAVKQFALTKTRQPGRGEGQQFAEGIDTQVLQHAESGVVADQPFEIASGSTGDSGTANPGSRKHIVEAV